MWISQFQEGAKLFKELEDLFEVKTVMSTSSKGSIINFDSLFDEMNDAAVSAVSYGKLFVYCQLLVLRSISSLNYFILASTYKFEDTTQDVKCAIQFLLKYIEHWLPNLSELPLLSLLRCNQLLNAGKADSVTDNVVISHEVLLFYCIYELLMNPMDYAKQLHNNRTVRVLKDRNFIVQNMNHISSILRNGQESCPLPLNVHYSEHFIQYDFINYESEYFY